ncbi:type I-E CRISPR-associated protein Cse2/CasB [Streptomyces pactum]|uniref:Type I-E CRISPR-associated protein Cse2/CasB n=1 Tax=Streptomyces pactum TaxID=68249 RepID=A0ABS0NQZ5_9ACTN|nr:type I-E CRISPR-associated protein Cse2/CasB [Streptomyces pactum]MBH5337625.1 type I-E CRISPR-associated protein Cse2/CasB [Streptomyces pactum]
MQAGYRQDAPWAVAAVARLRREAGRDAYASPTAWGLDHLETLNELREARRTAEPEGRDGGIAAPSYFSSAARATQEERERREDTAVHIAVTLWALHQQSLRDEPMHLVGWPLGRAVRRLAHGRTGVRDSEASVDGAGADPAEERVEDAGETVRRRFVRVGTASDTDVFATRLRELVLLLRSARIPLDYALLADQLLLWQDENRRDDVRRAWGRDFHRRHGRPDPAHVDGEGDEAATDSVPADDLA